MGRLVCGISIDSSMREKKFHIQDLVFLLRALVVVLKSNY